MYGASSPVLFWEKRKGENFKQRSTRMAGVFMVFAFKKIKDTALRDLGSFSDE
jgi:hypothetical protein